MSPYVIILDDLSRKDVRALISSHVSNMHSTTPKEFAFAMDVDALCADDINVWTLWDGDILMGCGALHHLDFMHGEIKSMRTHLDYLRRGVAAYLLEYIISEAHTRNYKKLSLETGTSAEFAPAVALYEKYGFEKGEVFGNYSESPYNQFFHLKIISTSKSRL